jgi:hypothetical protein
MIEDSRLNRLLKSKPFPVVDLINWTDKEKDEAVIAYLQDIGERGFAMTYAASGNYDKNRHYQNYEGAIRDLIDKYNEVNL